MAAILEISQRREAQTQFVKLLCDEVAENKRMCMCERKRERERKGKNCGKGSNSISALSIVTHACDRESDSKRCRHRFSVAHRLCNQKRKARMREPSPGFTRYTSHLFFPAPSTSWSMALYMARGRWNSLPCFWPCAVSPSFCLAGCSSLNFRAREPNNEVTEGEFRRKPAFSPPSPPGRHLGFAQNCISGRGNG